MRQCVKEMEKGKSSKFIQEWNRRNMFIRELLTENVISFPSLISLATITEILDLKDVTAQ